MLGATLALWGTASRLFGWRAAVCAAALFAVLAPTLQLGALATPDAMALFLLAASVWCVVSARNHDDSALLLVAGTLLLVAANATLYSTVIFDPSVVALAGLAAVARRGVKPAVARAGYVAAGVLGLISALLALGGPLYLVGVVSTAVTRAPGSPVLPALAAAWAWAGLVWVIAAAAVVLCARRHRDRAQVMTLAVLAASGVLPALVQARRPHHAFLLRARWFRGVVRGGGGRLCGDPATPAGAAEVAAPRAGWAGPAGRRPAAGLMGRAQATETFQRWPNSSRMVAELRSLTKARPGHYLAEGYNVPVYYLARSTSWQRWSGTLYFSYRPPGWDRTLLGREAYHYAIHDHYFALIVLDSNDTSTTDGYIQADIGLAQGYRSIATIRYSGGHYTIWAYGRRGSSIGHR